MLHGASSVRPSAEAFSIGISPILEHQPSCTSPASFSSSSIHLYVYLVGHPCRPHFRRHSLWTPISTALFGITFQVAP